MAKKTLKVAWATASVTAASNWFATDVSVGGSNPVKHILQCQLASANSVINVIMTRDSVSQTLALNGNVAVSAAVMVQQSYIVIPGTTYNVQHASTDQPIWAIVTEDQDNLTVEDL